MSVRGLLVSMLVICLCACGDDSGSGAEDEPGLSDVPVTDSPSQTVEPEPEPEPTGESGDCRVAASKWADRMTDHVLAAATTAAFSGETLPTEDLDDPSSEITVLCSEAIKETVLQANAKMAEINFELSLCAFGGECDAPTVKKVRRLADQTAPLVGQVRQQL